MAPLLRIDWKKESVKVGRPIYKATGIIYTRDLVLSCQHDSIRDHDKWMNSEQSNKSQWI